MKPLDDKTYKDALKSVKPDFDESMLWKNIEDGLDKKKKKKILIILFFGITNIAIAVMLYWNINTSEKYNASYQNTESTTITKNELEQVSVVLNNLKTKNKKIETESIEAKSTLGVNKNVKNKKEATKYSEKSLEKTITSKSKYQNSQKTNNSSNDQNKLIVAKHFEGNATDETEFTSKKVKYGIAPITDLQKINFISILPFLREMPNINLQSINPDRTEFQIKKSKNHRLLFAVSAGTPQSQYSANNPSTQSWAENSNQASTDLYTLGIMGSYNMDITPNFSMSLGLAIHRISERFNRTLENIETTTIQRDSASYIVNAQGQQQYYSGNRIQTSTTKTRVQQYNHFYNIGIATGAMYTQPISNKLSAYAESTLIYSPLHISTGRSINQDNELIKINTNAASQLIQLSANIGINYRINERFSYQLGILWRTDISNRYSTTDLNLQKRSIGLKLGALYNI